MVIVFAGWVSSFQNFHRQPVMCNEFHNPAVIIRVILFSRVIICKANVNDLRRPSFESLNTVYSSLISFYTSQIPAVMAEKLPVGKGHQIARYEK